MPMTLPFFHHHALDHFRARANKAVCPSMTVGFGLQRFEHAARWPTPPGQIARAHPICAHEPTVAPGIDHAPRRRRRHRLLDVARHQHGRPFAICAPRRTSAPGTNAGSEIFAAQWSLPLHEAQRHLVKSPWPRHRRPRYFSFEAEVQQHRFLDPLIGPSQPALAIGLGHPALAGFQQVDHLGRWPGANGFSISVWPSFVAALECVR